MSLIRKPDAPTNARLINTVVTSAQIRAGTLVQTDRGVHSVEAPGLVTGEPIRRFIEPGARGPAA